MSIQRVVKPTTRRGKRILEGRQPDVIEGPKQALIFNGRRGSPMVRGVLKDLYAFKKPDAKLLSRNNDITLFENYAPVEDLCRKHDTPIFVMGSHSKKRPDNIVIGRTYNHSLLDMVELGIDYYRGLHDFGCPKIVLGAKPCIVFNGPAWNENEDLKHLKSLFVDFFHREYVEGIRLQGLSLSLSFTATEDQTVMFRVFKVLHKKSGCRTPRIELEEIGPRIDFILRRSKLASEDLMKKACTRPKIVKVTKRRNVSRDGLGSLNARVHVGKQNIQNIQTRKMKGLKKTVDEKKSEKRRKRPLVVEIDSERVNEKRIRLE
ncbi:hypothetical protein FQR65_LT09227 [Abscondita terminalis]|nr:hypothetical protein FQR65_LT09227 [Abscondita terminalis]